MPSLTQNPLNDQELPPGAEPGEEKAFPALEGVESAPVADRQQAVRPLESTPGQDTAADAQTDGQDGPDYSWRRKAAGRRMRRGGEAGGAEEFEPTFIPPRVQDNSPVFELLEADLAGRVLPLRGEDARFRERLVIIAANLVAVLLTTVACAAAISAGTDEELLAGVTSSAEAKQEVKLWSEVKRTTSRIPEAGAVMAAFLRARTPEEKARFVRGGDAMLPAMHRYYDRHPDEPEGFVLTPGAEYGTHGGREFLFIHGTDPFGGTVETAAECTPSGVKLDWRFLTGAADMEWSDWISQRPSSPVSLRVEAVLDDYYAGPFSDPREWLCLKIRDTARTSAAWAYIQRNTDEGLTIYRELNGRGSPVRLLGVFEFPGNETLAGKTAPQVHLRSVSAQGWLDRSPDATTPVPLLTSTVSPDTDQP